MSERSERADGTDRTPAPEPGPAPTTPDAATAPAEPGRAPSGADGDELGATVAALTADDIAPARRRQLLVRMVGQARARGITDLFKPKAALRWMTDTVAEVAPHVPIRDLATLRRHFPGLDDDALADRLVRNASRATAGVGAAGGGVAAVEWAVTPTLLSAPVLLAAETVAVVAIELKLIGELHEIHRMPLPTGGTARAVALVQSWAGQRGINPMMPGVGVSAVLGTAARRELRDSLLRRFGRNLTTLGPFLTGAAVAGYLNRRATRALGEQLRKDLRHTARGLPHKRG
ncbi:hypothetical protein CO540_11170 [Micromonospora sp. WMMA2032]|uniref:EcsC protein family protein n=1 Tax=Micromonospora sediminicola TaxID=946078 RepID=A0A1A9BGC3_9ACTN|nr:hypothetical protein CO540_11170 [Micromonospora sp. WMMA2032]PGH46068.1 hypothetical protein COO58_17850 [Micromonospora sp. WMMA1996]SBT68014.1 hypothetical protein GA0070622_5103 [Micromonospora sediminicola]